MDRGCRRSYHPDTSKGEYDLRTKKILQQDVEKLYIGEEIASFYVYAAFFTTLWSVLTYSSGIPILYPIACLNYLVLYWVYKILLIKYYRKTVSFNQDLPNFSIYFFKVGIILHIVMGAFIFTNKKILNSDLLDVYEEQAGVSSLADEYASSDVGFFMFLIQRFTSGIGIFYLVFIILLIVGFILRQTLGLILGKILEALFKLLCCCCKKSEADLEKEDMRNGRRKGKLRKARNGDDMDLQVWHLHYYQRY